MLELQKYISQEFGLIRGLEINNIPYLVGKDIADKLGYQSSKDTIVRRVDEEDRILLDKETQRLYSAELDYKELGQRGGWIINESGFYNLVFGSELPTAKKFKHWVTSEVLPQIRKTGGYIPITETDTDEQIMAKALHIADKTIQEKDSLILQLKPKAEMCDKFLQSKGFVSMNKSAKGLKVGRNKMMAFLRTLSVLFLDDHDNMPYQQYVDRGYFIIDYHNGRDGKLHAVTKVSARGIEFIHKLYQKYATIKAVA